MKSDVTFQLESAVWAAFVVETSGPADDRTAPNTHAYCYLSETLPEADALLAMRRHRPGRPARLCSVRHNRPEHLDRGGPRAGTLPGGASLMPYLW